MRSVAFLVTGWPAKLAGPLGGTHLNGLCRNPTRMFAATGPPTKVVKVTFLTAGGEVAVEAQPGECLSNVAERAGVEIITSCGVGDCGTCEVELVQDVDDGSKYFIKTCVTRVPAHKDSLTLNVDGDLPPW